MPKNDKDSNKPVIRISQDSLGSGWYADAWAGGSSFNGGRGQSPEEALRLLLDLIRDHWFDPRNH